MTSDETSADEMLQASLDSGQRAPDNRDARAYQRVYRALAQSDASLPTNFAYHVRQQLIRKHLAKGAGEASLIPLLVAGVALVAGYAVIILMASLGYATDIRPPGIQLIRELSPVWGYAGLVAGLLWLIDSVYSRAHR
ncbi:MAG: hypothetical protein ACFHX7_15585 [Pseudomonadota bacterium]